MGPATLRECSRGRRVRELRREPRSLWADPRGPQPSHGVGGRVPLRRLGHRRGSSRAPNEVPVVKPGARSPVNRLNDVCVWRSLRVLRLAASRRAAAVPRRLPDFQRSGCRRGPLCHLRAVRGSGAGSRALHALQPSDEVRAAKPRASGRNPSAGAMPGDVDFRGARPDIARPLDTGLRLARTPERRTSGLASALNTRRSCRRMARRTCSSPAPALERATSVEEWFVRFEARPGAGVHATPRGASREPTETW